MGGTSSGALRGAFTSAVKTYIGESESLSGYQKFAINYALDSAVNDQERNARATQLQTVGGTYSQVTAGKFANGATTAAFSRDFNDEARHQISNKKYGKGYTNPITGELEYSNVEGFTPRLVDGKWDLGVDGKIAFYSREAQMDMAVYGYESAVVLQCQAQNDCTGDFDGPVPSNYNKPRISAKSSHLRVNLVGTGWFMSKSIPTLAIYAADKYYTTVRCASDVQVVLECTGVKDK